MTVTTQEELLALRKAGALLRSVLVDTAALVRPGITTAALDIFAEERIKASGGVAVFLGYQPQGASYPYPAAICVSLNDEVEHGIPSQERIIQAGDIVSLDLGLSLNGYYVDSGFTVVAGSTSEKDERLLNATKEALMAGIKAAQVGARTGDIGAAIEAIGKKYGYGIVTDLGGHGVGAAIHEKPYIANVGPAGKGDKLAEGMVIAIEPMFTEGKGDIVLAEDDWTYKTADSSRAAHFEHTVMVTAGGPEILTA